jgi:hypothetical protein
MKTVFRGLSGWKCAWALSWMLIFCIIGLTTAELSQFSGMVQFFGGNLQFNWNEAAAVHHYRIYLSERDLTVSPPRDTTFTLYSQDPALDVPAVPGHAYRIQVEALTASGKHSSQSQESPLYLCLGDSSLNSAWLLSQLPGGTALGPAYPNPFNPTTTIPYTVAPSQGASALVNLRIYNTLGQVVRRVVDGQNSPAGQYRAVWDGKNDQGLPVSAGTYICCLQVAEWSATKLLVLTK